MHQLESAKAQEQPGDEKPAQSPFISRQTWLILRFFQANPTYEGVNRRGWNGGQAGHGCATLAFQLQAPLARERHRTGFRLDFMSGQARGSDLSQLAGRRRFFF
jgi:hypothetical protein